MESDVGEPAIVARRRHPEPADRALPADLIGVEQVDGERSPLGPSGGKLAGVAIVRVPHGALPQTHVTRGDVDVAALAAEVLRGTMLDVAPRQYGPRGPASQHGDPGPDIPP